MQLSDFATPGFFIDPYPVYERLRAAGPFCTLAPGVMATGRHKVIEALLKDRRLGRAYPQGVALRYGQACKARPTFTALARMMLNLNPPGHTRLRGLLMTAFNKRQMAGLQTLVQEVANQLVDQMLAREDQHTDLIHDYALRLPVEVICRMLGIPIDDASQLAAATRHLTQALDIAPLNDAQLQKADQATLALEAYFRPLLAQRRRQPGNDLISLIVSLDDGSGAFTDEDLIANITLLFMAGHETTSGMIGNALISLFRHPAQWATLRSDPSCLPSAVVECLRFDSALQRTARTVLEDTEFEGQALHRGQIVVMFLGAANRDPARYEHADQLNITRTPDVARLMSFGGGIHYCLGARLAVMEVEIALGTLLRRLPRLALQNLDRLDWLPRNTMRSVACLAASWSA